MKKKSKTLFILLGILLLLFITFLFLTQWNKQQQEKAAVAAAGSQIQVTQISGLSALSYESATGSMSFENRGGVWYYLADTEIPISQSAVESIAGSYCNITASRRIAEPDAIADYGLDVPSETVYLTDLEGNSHTVKLGNLAGSERYLMLNDEETALYTVSNSLSSVLKYDLDTLAAKDSPPPIGSSNLLEVSILADGGMKSYSNGNDTSEDVIATILGGYGALSLTECASYRLTDEEKAEFKLDEGNRTTVTFDYLDGNEEEQGYAVYIGGFDPAGEQRYVQVSGSQLAYLVPLDTIDNLLGNTTFTDE